MGKGIWVFCSCLCFVACRREDGHAGTGGTSGLGAQGGVGGNSAGAPGTTDAGGGPIGAMGVDDPTVPATEGGTAYLRFCNPVAAADGGGMATLEVGGSSLTSAVDACAPSLGEACVAVPSGNVPVHFKVGGQDLDQGVWGLKPGVAYLVKTLPYGPAGKKATFLRPVVLESPDDCSALTAKEVGRRTAPAIPLAPFRGQDITFARPADLVPKDSGQPGSYVFERASPSPTKINRFQLTYFGRVYDADAPGAEHLLARVLSDRKLTVVTDLLGIGLWARAIADTGIDGPTRYLAIYCFRRYDTPDQLTSATDNILKIGIPGTLALMTVEVSAASIETLNQLDSFDTLNSIGWSASVVSAQIPANELPGGTWRSGGTGVTIESFTSDGVYTGSSSSGQGLDLSLEADGKFQLVTAGYTTCSEGSVCSKGYVITQSRGRYQFEGGVLTLSPFRCDQNTFDASSLKYARSSCTDDTWPLTLRLEPDQSGVVRINGIGANPLTRRQQTLRATRQGGPPGSWNEPKPPNRILPGEPSGPINSKFNACLIEEAEPNDNEGQATVVPWNKEVVGCFPTSVDRDYYSTAPFPPGPQGGYILASIFHTGPGVLTAGYIVQDGLVGAPQYAMKPGSSLFYVMATDGSKRHTFWTKRTPDYKVAPYTYSVKFTYTPVVDDYEPNDSVAQAKPLRLGVPIKAYLFRSDREADSDFYSMDLRPGTLRVRITDNPSNFDVKVSVTETNAPTNGLPSESLTGGLSSTPLEATYQIAVGGSYVVQVKSFGLDYAAYYSDTSDEYVVPESYRKQYTLVVDQP
jgi:hypothetical protein